MVYKKKDASLERHNPTPPIITHPRSMIDPVLSNT